MFNPSYQPLMACDRSVLRAARMTVQHHPAIPAVRPASHQPASTGRLLWTRLARDIAPEARP